MKKLLVLLIAISFGSTLKAQFVAKLQIKEPIKGICDANEVYALFPSLQGQVEAVCPVTKAEIEKRLNQIAFLKDKHSYKDKGMMGLIVNCNGELVQCKMDNKTKSSELDKQIEEVFSSLGSWKPGKLNGKDVDSSLLYSFKIKKGKIVLS